MSNVLVSFLFAIGCAGWVYNKSQQRNGGLAQRSLAAAGICGVLAFIVFLTILATVSSRFE